MACVRDEAELFEVELRLQDSETEVLPGEDVEESIRDGNCVASWSIRSAVAVLRVFGGILLLILGTSTSRQLLFD